jgi:hypothetical protein
LTSQSTQEAQWTSTLINCVGLTVDINDNAVRLERALLLAVGYAAWEVSEVKPLPRNDMEAWPKLITETGLTK